MVRLPKDLLLASDVKVVIANIGSAKAKEEDKKKIMGYYQNNKERMRYEKYRNIGCGIIGSGAIESAHRTVIQKRTKQSGQRWSTKGTTNMLRLRVISINKQWAKVKRHTNKTMCLKNKKRQSEMHPKKQRYSPQCI